MCEANSILKVVLESIVGPLIGSFVGFLGAWWLSINTFRSTLKQDRAKAEAVKQEEENNEEAKQIKNYAHRVVEAEGGLQVAIVTIAKNIGIFQGYAENIRNNNHSINMPSVVPIDKQITHSLRNFQLGNEWLSLCVNSDLHNQLIEDFKESYRAILSEMRKLLLSDSKVNTKVLNEENDNLAEFAEVIVEAQKDHLERTFRVLAILTEHADLNSEKSTKFKSMKAIVDYEVSEKKIASHIKAFRKHYDANKMFDHNSNI